MPELGFSTLLDIDKLTLPGCVVQSMSSFSTLLDIDKLTPDTVFVDSGNVLVLCWILINLHLM